MQSADVLRVIWQSMMLSGSCMPLLKDNMRGHGLMSPLWMTEPSNYTTDQLFRLPESWLDSLSGFHHVQLYKIVIWISLLQAPFFIFLIPRFDVYSYKCFKWVYPIKIKCRNFTRTSDRHNGCIHTSQHRFLTKFSQVRENKQYIVFPPEKNFISVRNGSYWAHLEICSPPPHPPNGK